MLLQRAVVFDKFRAIIELASAGPRTKTTRMGERSQLVPFSPADWITVVFLVDFTKWKWETGEAGMKAKEEGHSKRPAMGYVNWTDNATKSWEPRKAVTAEGEESEAFYQKLEGKRGEKRGRNHDVLQCGPEKTADKCQRLVFPKGTMPKKIVNHSIIRRDCKWQS